jgi:hypothetical protein
VDPVRIVGTIAVAEQGDRFLGGNVLPRKTEL